MAFDMLIGSDALRTRLASDVREHTLSHAYLVEGAVGSGRRTLATALCAAIACQHKDGGRLPCGECLACRKVLEGKSVDVIRVQRDPKKATIGVDEVRFLRTDVLLPPNELDFKIYIIEEADLLTPQAQNALLLTLEEPPSYVLFLLLCTSATSMLETIRSRAQLARLEPVPASAMKAYLSAHDRTFAVLPDEEQQQILLLSDGSVGRALVLTNEKKRAPLIERRTLAARCVSVLLGENGKCDVSVVPRLISDIGNKRDEVVPLLEDIQLALRDLILLKRADEVALRFYTEGGAALERVERVSVQALLSLYDTVEAARRQLLRNANVRLAMTSLFYR